MIMTVLEAQVPPDRAPALLDAYNIPYTFSDPLVLALSLHKGMTKHVIRDQGIATPSFAVIDEPIQARKVRLPMPLFAKPVAEGTSKGVDVHSKINSLAELESVCAQPVSGSHASVVHGLLSSQRFAVLAQLPVAVSQLSTVQGSLSLQLFMMPGWQAPPVH